MHSVWKNILSVSREIVAVTEIFIADMQDKREGR